MTSADHIHHDVAEAWLERWDGLIASSPVTQGALVRFVLRSGGTTTEAITVMRDLHESPRHEFWEDTLGYDQVDLRGVVGHRQVTDAYLASTALVAGMVAGADSNVDLDLLRHGGMHRIFGGIRAPSTCGTFLRTFPFGHVLQLGAVSSRLLAALAGHAPLLGGADQISSHAATRSTGRRCTHTDMGWPPYPPGLEPVGVADLKTPHPGHRDAARGENRPGRRAQRCGITTTQAGPYMQTAPPGQICAPDRPFPCDSTRAKTPR